jgi:hypothetical protein
MAAGLGFKTFAVGEVLSAANVNGYLMQGVLVFADTTARDAAITSPQEGQFAYLKDTNVTTYYTGSAWANLDTTGMTNPMTTTGDTIYSSSGSTPARLGIGSTGQVLTVSGGVPSWATPASASSDQFYAGKNKIINGDFNINQRNFTSNTASNSFNFDRWYQLNFGGGSFTVTPQTFALGTAPVAGYEGKNYLQGVTAGQSLTGDGAILIQTIESVRSFAGQTVTISFWAKANTGTPKIAAEMYQTFGTGGSPSTAVSTYAGQATLSTSWARYSLTVAVPSISGKTLGTNNNDYISLNLWTSAGSTYNSRTGSLGNQNFTAQIWGVQVEAGSTATSFQTATGTIQGELAACQRYYWRTTPGTNPGGLGSFGTAKSTTAANFQIQNPVVMRIAPTSVDYANIVVFDTVNGFALSSISIGGVVNASSYMSSIEVGVTSGLTQFRPYFLYTNNASGYLGFNAEL